MRRCCCCCCCCWRLCLLEDSSEEESPAVTLGLSWLPRLIHIYSGEKRCKIFFGTCVYFIPAHLATHSTCGVAAAAALEGISPMVALRGRLPILRGGGGFLLPPCGGWRPGVGARRREAVAEAEAGPAEAEAAELSLRIPCCCCGAGLMPGGATEAQVRLNMEPGIGKKISKKKIAIFCIHVFPLYPTVWAHSNRRWGFLRLSHGQGCSRRTLAWRGRRCSANAAGGDVAVVVVAAAAAAAATRRRHSAAAKAMTYPEGANRQFFGYLLRETNMIFQEFFFGKSVSLFYLSLGASRTASPPATR